MNDINSNMKNTRRLVVISMLAALSAVLMFIELPLPFIAPPFYKLDFSEVPVLIGSFSLGPVAGIIIEAVKILVKLCIKGTETGFVGEIANFVIGISLVVPASLIYRHNKTKKTAIISLIISTVIMSVVGVFLNAYLLLPAYSVFLPIEQIVQMGKDIFPIITDKLTFCLFCILPFNLIKGIIVSIITILIYKPLSNLIHQN